MVAVPTSSATIHAFPTREASSRARRLHELLAALADEGGSWVGSQEDLAAQLKVDVRTIGRATADIDQRGAGLIETIGRGGRLTYVVLVLPGTSDTSDNHLSEPLSEVVRATSDRSPIQMRPSRAGGSSSSSSSSSDLGQLPSATTAPVVEDLRHLDTSDKPTPDTSDRHHGDDGGATGGDGGRLTAFAELKLRFGVEPDAEMARRWATLTPAAKAHVAEQARIDPPRRKNGKPVPAWMNALIATGEDFDSTNRLRARTGIRTVWDEEPQSVEVVTVAMTQPERAWMRPASPAEDELRVMGSEHYRGLDPATWADIELQAMRAEYGVR